MPAKLRWVPSGAGRSAQAHARRAHRLPSHLVAAVAAAAIGFLAITSGISAHAAGDLAPERETDLAGLVEAQSNTNKALQAQQNQLDKQVAALAAQTGSSRVRSLQAKSQALEPMAGLRALRGPGVRVTLDDAPRTVDAQGVDADALVVHQQDIQAVVNALWAGGAQGVSVQGQRLISTSAIRCVGNSVVLQGVPYPPPYTIEAVGDVPRLMEALAHSRAITIYLQYVQRYGLGYDLEQIKSLTLPGYAGSIDLTRSRPLPAK
jgi:uncharacterized protein YlxW (UPF0749 family)